MNKSINSITHSWLFCLLPLFTVLFSCNKDNKGSCLKSTGEVIIEVRTLTQFTELEIEDNFNVYITIDTVQKVIIEAGENLLPFIKSEVTDGRLHLQNNNRCNWARSYKHEVNAYITVPEITKIIHLGYGTVKGIDTIITNKIWITVDDYGEVDLKLNVGDSYCDTHNSGDLILRGVSNYNDMWISGNNWIRCSELETGFTRIRMGSTGDCFVYAKNKLDVIITGSGNVYYSGNPSEIISEITGSGQLIAQ